MYLFGRWFLHLTLKKKYLIFFVKLSSFIHCLLKDVDKILYKTPKHT